MSAARLMIVLAASLLLSGCFHARGEVGLGGSRRFRATDDKGRVTLAVRVIDSMGSPVSGVPVTVITDRNETMSRSTSSPESSLGGFGTAGIDPSQSLGAAQFVGLRGPIRSVEVWVGGNAATFSELDIQKGWDSENNVVNLVVRHWSSSFRSVSGQGAHRQGTEADETRSIDPAAAVRRDCDQSEVNGPFNGWLSAWRDGNLERYLGYYDREYGEPDRLSWVKSRETALRQRGIRVDVLDFESVCEDGGIRTGFTQVYRSSGYSDTGVKTLLWRRSDAGWVIVNESWRAR